jgi:hypothetical protein
MPREEYVHNVRLLGNLVGNNGPGRYFIVAVYNFNGLLSVSDPYVVELELPS